MIQISEFEQDRYSNIPHARNSFLESGPFIFSLTYPKQAGGIHPEAGSSLCCAETVSSGKLKLCDFYYILIGFNSEYKPVTWEIHCFHHNALVEE